MSRLHYISLIITVIASTCMQVQAKNKKRAARMHKKNARATDIFSAAAHGLKPYKKLLDQQPSLITTRDTFGSPGSSTLHYALGYRNPLVALHTIKKLQALPSKSQLELATKPNQRGNTPLEVAIIGGSPRLIVLAAILLRSLNVEISQADIDLVRKHDKESSHSHWRLPNKVDNSMWEAVSTVSENPLVEETSLVYYLDLFTDLSQQQAQNALNKVLAAYKEEGDKKTSRKGFINTLDNVVQEITDMLDPSDSNATGYDETPAIAQPGAFYEDEWDMVTEEDRQDAIEWDRTHV